MNRHRNIVIFSLILALLALGGVAAVVLVANRPVVAYKLFSAPAVIVSRDPTEMQAAEQTLLVQILTEMSAGPNAQGRAADAASLTSSATPITAPMTGVTEQTMCGWQWATQPNPDLSAQIQQRMIQSFGGEFTAEAIAESYGENCLNADGSVRSFAAMQTDFRVTVWLDEFSMESAAESILSPLAEHILRVLLDYPTDETPGPQPGMIGLEFSTQAAHLTTSYWLWADYTSAMTALNQGLTGSALFDALGGLHQQDESSPPD